MACDTRAKCSAGSTCRAAISASRVAAPVLQRRAGPTGGLARARRGEPRPHCGARRVGVVRGMLCRRASRASPLASRRKPTPAHGQRRPAGRPGAARPVRVEIPRALERAGGRPTCSPRGARRL
jgi:hypothetical protein